MAQHLSGSANEPDSVNPVEPVLMNLNLALERMDGDADLLREIIDIFLEDHIDGLRELRAASQARDNSRLQRAAHTLKGAVGNFVAVQATNLALRLEATCKGGDLEGGLALVDSLEREVSRLAVALRAVREKEAA